MYQALIWLATGKKYTLLDGVALVCMSVGLILFTLADSTVQPNFDQTGMYMYESVFQEAKFDQICM